MVLRSHLHKLAYIVFMVSIVMGASSILVADVTITAPGAGTTSITPCKDYFTAEWGLPLDMSDADHGPLFNILPLEMNDLTGYSYSNGIMSTTASGDDPWFRLVQFPIAGSIPDENTTRWGTKHPIDGNTYKILTMRMYTDRAQDIQVKWNKADDSSGNSVWAISDPVTTAPGWQTYAIDLSTVGINDGSGSNAWTSGGNLGLRIDPTRMQSGASIKIDWIRLTTDSCATLDATFSSNSGEVVSLFVDDNTNIGDGFLKQTTLAATGTTQTASFQGQLLSPDISYYVVALQSDDYATHNINPWDFDSSDDIARSSEFNIVGGTVSGGTYSGTTGSDANFSLNIPAGNPIDSSVFNKFSMEMDVKFPSGTVNNLVGIMWFDTNGAVLGSNTTTIPIVSGTNILTYDLSAEASWTGEIGRFRITPAVGSNIQFTIKWISIGRSTTNTEPNLSSTVASSGTASVRTPEVVSFIQPDNEGGEDYFTTVRGNPSNMGDTGDIDYVDGLEEAIFYPGNSYTDSAGNVRIDDYFEAINVEGNGDPQNFSVFVDNERPIDPTKFKVACYTVDLLLSIFEYHSVARVLWQHDNENYNGDDVILKTVGESRVCLRMDNMQLEPELNAGEIHPWRKNTDGTDINFWRIDVHEEEFQARFRLNDIRLATDHTANDQFAIVLGGDRTAAVSVYYTTTNATRSGILIKTLSANRTSDVLLWDTRGLAAGTYYLYATVGEYSYMAPAPVVVDHTVVQDRTPPVVVVQAPAAGHQFRDSIEITGYVIDSTRIATIEAFIGSSLIHTFRPNLYHAEAKATYGSYPYSSSAGFQQEVDISSLGLADGSHTFRLDVYDTAGNKTSYSQTVTKGAATTAAVTLTVPNETAVLFTNPVVPGANLDLAVKLDGDDLTFTITGGEDCEQVRLLGGTEGPGINDLRNNDPTFIQEWSSPASSVSVTATNVKGYSGSGTIVYFAADCGNGPVSDVERFDVSTIESSSKVSTLKELLDHVRDRVDSAPGSNLALSLDVSKRNFRATITGAENCSQVRLLANYFGPSIDDIRSKDPTFIYISDSPSANMIVNSSGFKSYKLPKNKARAKKVRKKLKKKKKDTIYIAADCGDGPQNATSSFKLFKIKGKKKTGNIKKIIDSIRDGVAQQ